MSDSDTAHEVWLTILADLLSLTSCNVRAWLNFYTLDLQRQVLPSHFGPFLLTLLHNVSHMMEAESNAYPKSMRLAVRICLVYDLDYLFPFFPFPVSELPDQSNQI